jgi:hypothetical protein
MGSSLQVILRQTAGEEQRPFVILGFLTGFGLSAVIGRCCDLHLSDVGEPARECLAATLIRPGVTYRRSAAISTGLRPGSSVADRCAQAIGQVKPIDGIILAAADLLWNVTKFHARQL